MSFVQVFFTSTPEKLVEFRDPVSLRRALGTLSLRSGGIKFADFEHQSGPEQIKLLEATIAGASAHWTLKDNVWDFHAFRNEFFDLSQAVISWEMVCSIQVGKKSHQIIYSSMQTFEDFERAILSSVLVKDLSLPAIEVKIKTTSGSSSTALFKEKIFRELIVENQPIDLLVRSEHASYSLLKARYVLPKSEYTPFIDTNMESGNGNGEISALFKTLTNTPDDDFTTRVCEFAEIMLEKNRNTPFGMFLGFEYLRFIRSSFPAEIIDWNETQRRTICDPVMYTLATILSCKVHEEIDVWPHKNIPKEATGHGPLDYYLPGPAAIVGLKGNKRPRDDEEGQENEDRQENEDSVEHDVMSEKKTSTSVESALAQVLAQALDTMRDGSLPDLGSDAAPKGNRRFCVLSTGQKYYFFRIDWNRQTKPRVTYLGLYRFRYFPSRYGTSSNLTDRSTKRSSSDLGASDAFSANEYVAVLAAFLVCILDGQNGDCLRSTLDAAAERYKAFKLDAESFVVL